MTEDTTKLKLASPNRDKQETNQFIYSQNSSNPIIRLASQMKVKEKSNKDTATTKDSKCSQSVQSNNSPTQTSLSGEGTGECSLCHETLACGPIVTLSKCNHSFHSGCLIQCFALKIADQRASMSCPIEGCSSNSSNTKYQAQSYTDKLF